MTKPMPIPLQTLKGSLETLIDRHGLAEVLDRLADIINASDRPHASQITSRLEQAVELALIQEEPGISQNFRETVEFSPHFLNGESHASEYRNRFND